MGCYIPIEQLNYVASKYVERYYRLIGRDTDGYFPPIDPTILAEQVLNLELQYLPLSIDGSILGMAVFESTELVYTLSNGNMETVTLDEKNSVIDTALLGPEHTGRRNFTISHENAHHVLEREFPGSQGITCKRKAHVLYRRSNRYDPVEWRADALASMMLMPRPLILDSMRRFGLPINIDMINRVFRPELFAKFEQVALFLGVSKQALCIRLKQLKMVRKEYLANPYDLVNVYMDD